MEGAGEVFQGQAGENGMLGGGGPGGAEPAVAARQEARGTV